MHLKRRIRNYSMPTHLWLTIWLYTEVKGGSPLIKVARRVSWEISHIGRILVSRIIWLILITVAIETCSCPKLPFHGQTWYFGVWYMPFFKIIVKKWTYFPKTNHETVVTVVREFTFPKNAIFFATLNEITLFIAKIFLWFETIIESAKMCFGT